MTQFTENEILYLATQNFRSRMHGRVLPSDETSTSSPLYFYN